MVTKRTIDNAFLYLKPVLEEVFATLHEPQIATIHHYDFICLSPYERYRQQSNSSVNIQLGQDYVVQLVTLCGTVIVDVTDRVFIEEFQHRTTGLTNVYFEMINLPAQSQPVCLKFTAPILSAKTAFYSNPFVIQDRPKETTRLDYWSRELFDGVDYETTDALLSIRVLGHFTQPKPQEQVQVYSQTSARGSINTQIESIGTELQPWAFTCEYITNHGLKAFQSFRRTPIKYINGIRCTSMTTSYETVLGQSNFYRAEWNAFMDETEEYTDESMIANPYTLTPIAPTLSYTISSLPTTLSGNFTQNITLGTGNLIIYNSLNVAVAIYDQSAITVIGSTFSINISGDITVEADYYVNFESGLFVSVFNQNIFLESKTEWTFGVYTGEFENTEFSNEFLLN
jgi:hypothetical protein